MHGENLKLYNNYLLILQTSEAIQFQLLTSSIRNHK